MDNSRPMVFFLFGAQYLGYSHTHTHTHTHIYIYIITENKIAISWLCVSVYLRSNEQIILKRLQQKTIAYIDQYKHNV